MLLGYNIYMAKERLSKLQKWVLIQAYKNDGEIFTGDIYREFFGLNKKEKKLMEQMKKEKFWEGQSIEERHALYKDMKLHIYHLRQEKAPIVSKSLKTLKERGFLRQKFHHHYIRIVRDERESSYEKKLYLRIFKLTAKGIPKAEELIKKEQALKA